MKAVFLPLFAVAIIFSASAQQSDQNQLTFKSYASLIFASNNLEGNRACYGFNKFQIGGPAFGFSFLSGKNNYHQIELSDISVQIDKQNFPTTSNGYIGFRYSYNLNLLKTKDERLKAFVAPSAHLLVNYYSVRWSAESHADSYTTITSELEVSPVISYRVCSYFSLEANFPISLFGNTSEFSSAENSNQRSLFLGPEYFQFRFGIATNL